VVRAAYVATIALLAGSMVLTWNLERPRGFDMSDRTNEVLFRMLSEGRGLLLTGADLHLVQLRTRRAVLLDGGGLDTLPYAIESAPEMDRILREVYGVDLLNPPEEARYRGSVPPEFTKNVWQGYSRDQWNAVAERFGVRQVLTPGDWDLKFPFGFETGR
jgi:ABC-type amino acid transport substrate-binding protein